MRIYLNDGWKFCPEFSDAGVLPDYDERGMESVRLPHSFVETPLHYFDESLYQMVGLYRRTLTIPEDWRGKKVLLTFEGAAHDSTVYLGGIPAASHHCGYTAFTVDLTDRLRYGGENVLAVRLDSRETLDIPPFGFVIDYMTYGGIYRDVYLERKAPESLDDVFLFSELSPDGTARLRSEIRLSAASDALSVRQFLIRGGSETLLGQCPAAKSPLVCSFDAGTVALWDTEHPTLYEIRTELVRGDTVLDEKVQHFGFRTACFRADGFYLNGKKTKLRGLNRHQSYPYVGYAMPASMQRLDADILKHELGLNAVRTSHYPQSQDFIDRCDELGLLVFTEIPGWQHIGGEAWKAQAVENVRDMVVQYRSHPSIILWGVRINESQDDDEFYRKTNAAAHALDPTRPTGGVRFHKKSSFLEDVYTYNDFVHEGDNRGCEKKNSVTPDRSRAYLISEYAGHMYPTKPFDDEEHRLSHALRHANVLEAVAEQPDIAGSFGWCMFDYNTHRDFGSGDRVCYHGVTDFFRNPKLAAAVYASQSDETPVLEVSSSMDIGEHPACHRGDTYVFTNAPKIRMYKGSELIRSYTRADSPYHALPHGPIPLDDFVGDSLRAEGFSRQQEKLVKNVLNAYAKYGLSHMSKKDLLAAGWLVARYHMGLRRAADLYNQYVGNWGGESSGYRFEALDEHGTVVKTVVKEPMERVHLSVRCDHTDLRETRGYDVAAIRIRAEDDHGNLLTYFGGPAAFTVSGPIGLIGPNTLTLMGGMGGTYVKSCGATGRASLTIKASQAEPVTISFSIFADEGGQLL